MVRIYKYIIIWPNGNIHHYIAHSINEIVDDLLLQKLSMISVSVLKREIVPSDFKEPNNIILGRIG